MIQKHNNCNSESDLSNCSEELEYQRERRVVNIFLTIYGIFILLILLGNGLVIWLVVTKKKLQSVTNFYVVSLCVSDICVATFAIPMEIASHFSENGITTATCRLIEFFVYTSIAANIFCVVALTVDRYRSVMYPFSHRHGKKIPILIMAVFWLISFAYAGRIVPLYDVVSEEHLVNNVWETFIFCSLNHDSNSNLHIYVLVDFFITYLLPLTAIICMYVRVTKKILFQKRQVSPSDYIGQKKKKLLRMLMLIVGLFAVCQLPTHVYYLKVYWGSTFTGHLIVYQVCDIISFSNSWLNVIVYAFLNDNFKREIKSLIYCKRRGGKKGKTGITTIGMTPTDDPTALDTSAMANRVGVFPDTDTDLTGKSTSKPPRSVWSTKKILEEKEP